MNLEGRAEPYNPLLPGEAGSFKGGAEKLPASPGRGHAPYNPVIMGL